MSPSPNNSAAQVDESPFTSGAEMIQVHYCITKPLTEKLVEMGYFSSSPVQPQIAFNLSLMNFLSFMFIHTIPNITGFIKTIVAHLTLRKYKIPLAVSCYHLFAYVYGPNLGLGLTQEGLHLCFYLLFPGEKACRKPNQFFSGASQSKTRNEGTTGDRVMRSPILTNLW